MDLKVVGALAAGVAAGFVLGGLGPRRQVQELEARKAALEAELATRGGRSGANPWMALMPGLARRADPEEAGSALTASSDAMGASSDAIGARATPDAVGADGSPGGRGDTAVIGATNPDRLQGPSARPGAPGGTDSTDRPWFPRRPSETGQQASGSRPRRGRERLADFDRFASAQTARIAATRAALVEQADLSDQQVAEVDQATRRMNDRLSGYGEEIITQMDAEEPPGPSQALGLGHDVSGILYDGQQELDRIVGDRTDDVEPEARAIWNFVDVEQWRPFVEAAAASGSEAPSAGAAVPQQGAAGAGDEP